MRRLPICLFFLIGVLLFSLKAGAQLPIRPDLSAEPLVISNPILRAGVRRISERSPLWRDAMASLRDRGRQAILLTPGQVRVAADSPSGRTERFDPTVLAEVAPVPDNDSRVDVVLVVINLALLEESHRHAGSLQSDFEADLDRILVHEVYAHAVPYLLAGHLAGRCPDPTAGERAVDACSIRRENAVRAELGLGRRTTYGLDDLNIFRRARH
jgi:hypothetical protein